MEHIVWVGLGGGIGSAARYFVGLWAVRLFGAAFPYGTLAVNLTGSLVFMLLLTRFSHGVAEAGGAGLRLALTTGAMGGFTTYSAFNYELLTMIEAGRWGVALGYGATTVVGALGVGAMGLWMGR